ncbi:MAG: D-alanyl-D-alanine carboxypeptidase family protein [Pseudomonadota bacterium]
MRRFFIGLIAALVFVAPSGGSTAFAAVKKKTTNAALRAVEAVVLPKPDRPQLVIDAASGTVIHAQEARALWHPASLTKLMTAYVAFQAIKSGRARFDTPLTVSAYANQQKPSKMGFKPGSVVSLEAALYMIMVKSANDMSVAIAEGISGSVPSFVNEMNVWSQKLGMTDTIWNNPNGLPDPVQITSARDLAILARALLIEFPDYQPFLNTGAIQVGNAVIKNHNPLLDRFEGADGLKTGYICSSGFNMVATATRNGRRHIAVVLGADSSRARTEWAALLLEKSFAAPSREPGRGFFNSNASQTFTTLASLPRSMRPSPIDMKSFVCSRAKRNDMEQVTSEILAFAPQDNLSAQSYGMLQMSQTQTASDAKKKKPQVSLLGARASSMQPLLMQMDPGDAQRGLPLRVALAGRDLPPPPVGYTTNIAVPAPLPLASPPPATSKSTFATPSPNGSKKNSLKVSSKTMANKKSALQKKPQVKKVQPKAAKTKLQAKKPAIKAPHAKPAKPKAKPAKR